MQWAQVPLHALLQVAGSGTWGREPGGPDPTYPVLRSTNIQDGRFRFDDVALRSVAAKTAEKYSLRNGDILVTTSSGSAQLLGKNAIVESLPTGSGPYLFSNFTWRLRLTPTLAYPKFLYFYLNSATARAELQRIQSTTSGLRNLNTALYLDQPVPLPPLSEQRRIVEILDQADHLRRLRAEADSKAVRILPALFIKMFGDPRVNDRNWPLQPVGNLLLMIRNGCTVEQNTEGRGFPVTRIETISAERINPARVRYVELEDSEVRKWRMMSGDILFSHINSEPHIGRTALYEGEPHVLIHGMNLLLMRPDIATVQPRYLLELLRMPAIRVALRQRCKRAVNQASLNQTDVCSLEVPVPPLELQERFAALARQLARLRSLEEKASEGLQRTVDVLAHRAFAGELTSCWREAHMNELLQEMEQQAKLLGAR